jgi:exodeoxyribonuclease V alpha subunit
VLRALAVVTGGPGTGKTTTVLAVLALLVEQALARGEAPPRIALAAPTGKAAARLAESVVSGRARLALPPDVSTHVPAEATTLHRLLGWQPRTPTRFRHDAAHPLPYDVVVVDESSMVDLALMAKLLDAVPSHARLVLLGDRDQLASVEAGTILADVCGDGDVPCSAEWSARLATLRASAPSSSAIPASAAPSSAIADCVVRLRVSRRFHDDGGIGALARAINDGDAARALAVLEDDDTGQVVWEPSDGGADRAALAPVRRLALPAYRQSVTLDGPAAALAALDRFRVLAAHRAGTVGVAGLNGAIVEALAREGTLPRDAAGARWWHGQPVMVTENDHALELYNGDVGVVLRDGASGLRVWFRASDGGVRALAPARLPAHETVFAMTVHKSQGSEFDEVVLVLPPRPSPVLTRELLYTGVTRAKSKVTVVGSAEVLRAGIAERVQRASGLREALWGS